MQPGRIALVASWIATSVVLGIALFSTPYMRKVLQGNAVESARGTLTVFGVGAVVCAWPWLLAYALPQEPSPRTRQYVFSVISVAISLAFFFPISNGRDFSIGLNVIFCIVAIWLAYPLTRIGPR
jgi:hypothetical protein